MRNENNSHPQLKGGKQLESFIPFGGESLTSSTQTGEGEIHSNKSMIQPFSQRLTFTFKLSISFFLIL